MTTSSVDIIEHLGNSLIQHGPGNDRIYLMHLDMRDYPVIVSELLAMAERHGYSKVFAKVPGQAAEMFLSQGFECEAKAPGLFRYDEARHDALFLGRFLSKERRQEDAPEKVADVLRTAERKANATGKNAPIQNPTCKPYLAEGYSIRPMTEADTEEMAKVYAAVFPSYPFPIQDPAFLRQCMRENVRFMGAVHDGRIAALASAEIADDLGTAEMTDFATLPDHLGKKLAQCLLDELEKLLPPKNIGTAFTIARAVSYGMNITFARRGYSHGGTLVNNTNISGSIESMNVWYKALDASC
jgi:putative beta-lysine N-acetyltransferase